MFNFNGTTLHESYSIQRYDKSFIYSKYLQKCDGSCACAN